MIEGLSIKAGEAIQLSFSVKEMRMEPFVAFLPLARLNYCVLLLRAICSGLSHISKSVLYVCVENASLMGRNIFFYAENKVMCKDCCDICDLHGNAVAVCTLFKTEMTYISWIFIWLYRQLRVVNDEPSEGR